MGRLTISSLSLFNRLVNDSGPEYLDIQDLNEILRLVSDVRCYKKNLIIRTLL